MRMLPEEWLATARFQTCLEEGGATLAFLGFSIFRV